MIKYVFTVDGREVAPRRSTFRMAAYDAVNAGYAVWWGRCGIKMEPTQGGAVEEVEDGEE